METETKEKQLRKEEKQLRKEEKQLRKKEKQLGKKEKQLNKKDEQLCKKDEDLRDKEKQLCKKDEDLRDKEKQLCKKDEDLRDKEKQLGKKDEDLRDMEKQLGKKDEELRDKEKQLGKKDEELRDKERMVAGLGPGCIFSAVGTRMMKALRSLPAVPEPGQVLNLECDFLLHLGYSSMFIRKCYVGLFNKLIREMPKKHIITGTPGIGKSWFLFFILAKLVTGPSPPPAIVWEHMTMRGKAWCYIHETGEVVVGQLNKFEGVLHDPKSWYIADGVPPQLTRKARIVLLTSPKRTTYKEVCKECGELLYMPFWTQEELLKCRSLLYSTVPETLALELFKHYGGVARYVLKAPKENPQSTLGNLLAELRAALSSCNTKKIRVAIGGIDSGAAVTHRLLHIVVNVETFKMQHLDFASKWVALQFAKKALENELKGMVTLLRQTSGTLQAMLYEATMHAVLPKGGCFTVVPVNHRSLKRGEEEEVELCSCEDTEFFKDLQTVGKNHQEGVYYRPRRVNFPTIDSLSFGKGTCDLFQMTVGRSKVVDAGVLDEMLKKMHLIPDVTLRLYYVVPPDTYNTFTLSRGGDWPLKGKGPASRVNLYILEGKYDRRQDKKLGSPESPREAVRAPQKDIKRKRGVVQADSSKEDKSKEEGKDWAKDKEEGRSAKKTKRVKEPLSDKKGPKAGKGLRGRRGGDLFSLWSAANVEPGAAGRGVRRPALVVEQREQRRQ